MLFHTLIAAIILAAGPAIAQTPALYRKANPKLFVGSENFSEPSLTKNREVGILFTDGGILSPVQQTVQADFFGGTIY
jgi:phosphatidylserine/phosphatidylglycerophosphate/cardiolipin synthase-like enzyme